MTIDHDLDLPALGVWANAQTPHALFWSISGAHLYGFPSVDSDVDIRGAIALPLPKLIGLKAPTETVEAAGIFADRETELVAHDLGKYLRLMLRHNGYVLEQVFSPLIAFGSEFLARLRPLAAQCVTRNCYHHYRGFLATQRKMMDKDVHPKAKTLLYSYRVVLTGIHLLRTGEVQSHLPTLNEEFRLAFIPELIARKQTAEFGTLNDLDVAFHRSELDRFEAVMERAFEASTLPELGPMDALDLLLVNVRLGR